MPVAVVLMFVVAAVTCIANAKFRDQLLVTNLHSQTLGFVIVGALDSCYLFMLFSGAANLTAFSIAIQLQTPVVFALICRLIFTAQSYRFMHYLGAVILLVAIVLDIQQSAAYGNSTSALLVFFSYLPYTISQMLKLAMLRTGAFCCFSFNKWTLFFTFIFALGLLILVSILDSTHGDKFKEIATCLSCTVGGEGCVALPLWLGGFIFCSMAYQALVYFVKDRQIGRQNDHARIASAFNIALSCLGFIFAGLILQNEGPHLFEWVRPRQGCSLTALLGCLIYFYYQEYPPKLCHAK